jgi:hypothetical protein
MDEARNGAAALDRRREVDRLAGIVQWWSLAAGLVSPMAVVVPLEVRQHPPQVLLTVKAGDRGTHAAGCRRIVRRGSSHEAIAAAF